MASEHDDDLLDIISDAIDESMDVDWTSRDGARHVLGALQIGGYIRTAAMDALIADSADMIDAPASADALGEVERVANALANADLDGPDPDDYWTSLATAALSAMSPAGEVEGWIVGNADGTQWRTWEDGLPLWTVNIDHACRYARRIDAESAHQEDEDAWRIVPYTKGPTP